MAEPVVIAAREPIEVEVEAGRRYRWCACGRSATQPFCDDTHKGTGISPMMYVAKTTEKLWFCRCKHSSDKPFCDGTHNTL
ncbi:MAG: CDGSH iron-sulfur domain-containing protein [Alphaproteobacteria bacterium]|nr:CDGSH iron-sulfur domain-containing protein [Alphaproteobacteria bacterium]